MITGNMKLNSKSGARQWASDCGLNNDVQVQKLANWLWENKPYIGCTINEHPLQNLSTEEFWEIVEN